MSAPTLGDLFAVAVTAPVVAVGVPASGAGVVAGGGTLLSGWSFRETTGAAAARVDIFDGLDAGGQLVATITLAANESTRDSLSVPGIWCRRGVFVNVVAGAVAGAVWVSGRGQ